MIVVSNTSPLCYLILIGSIEVLPTLYGEILTTQTVLNELCHPDAPERVRVWANTPPGWLKVRSDPSTVDSSFAILHGGERTAIVLAEQIRADIILLDDSAARELAAERKLKICGLLGILRNAAQAGLLDLPTAVDRLLQTSFRASPELLRSLLTPPKD